MSLGTLKLSPRLHALLSLPTGTLESQTGICKLSLSQARGSRLELPCHKLPVHPSPQAWLERKSSACHIVTPLRGFWLSAMSLCP